MHASSFENMRKCYRDYIEGRFLDDRRDITVLDVGGADVNGSYRDIFRHPRIRYIAADLEAKQGVHLLLRDPYHIPLSDASVDVVISGQVLEHSEFFWLAFQEMMRLVRPDGYLFLVVPSAGPIHRYPVDCYRFYPDALGALAKYTNSYLEAFWMDERGPWNDLVGVFRKTFATAVQYESSPRARGGDTASAFWLSSRVSSPAPLEIAPGAPETEIIAGDGSYLDCLALVHRTFVPRCYLEIGVRKGTSLRLAQCPSIGIDPEMQLEVPLSAHCQLYHETSDDFFERHAREMLREEVDLVFIDGMHLFECALRDFMHAERFMAPAGMIILDDIFPNHPLQASRERSTRVWCGDVWKLHACLRQNRPDLTLVAVDCAPAGLLLVMGLDPTSRVLWQNYNPLVRQYASSGCEPPPPVLARAGAVSLSDPRLVRALMTLRNLQEKQADFTEVHVALHGLDCQRG